MQRKARAFARCAGDLYFAVMGFHYLLHQRQAQSGSLRLGGIIGAEYLVDFVLGNTFARIFNIQQQNVPTVGVFPSAAGLKADSRGQPPPGMACMAFRNRLSRTCVMRSASSMTSGQRDGTSRV